MRLLYDNDTAGQYSPALYTDEVDAAARAVQPTLHEHRQADVVVIGAGFTGLSTALHLAELDVDVAVLEAHRAGWGASGRNGGQLGSGYNLDPDTLVNKQGIEHATALWNVAEGAKQAVHDASKRHNFTIDYQPGVVLAAHRKRAVAAMHQYAEGAARHFGYEHCELLDREALRAHVVSDAYHGGAIDRGAGHVNPLKLALGLADSALQRGAQLYERSAVVRIERRGEHWRAVTASGTVTARHLVFATNGYHDDLLPELSAHIMPINSFVVATDPLGAQAEALLPSDAAVADSRFVVGYFRRSRDNRLVYGGGEGYRYRFPARPEQRVKRSLSRIFPQLANTRFSHCWGGTLAVTPDRMPYVQELKPGLFAAGGYSGHGVALAVGTGQALAEAIHGDRTRLDPLTSLQPGKFPGGRRARPWLLTAAMTAASAGDRL